MQYSSGLWTSNNARQRLIALPSGFSSAQRPHLGLRAEEGLATLQPCNLQHLSATERKLRLIFWLPKLMKSSWLSRTSRLQI